MATATKTAGIRVIHKPTLNGEPGLVEVRQDYYVVEDGLREMIFEKLSTHDRHIVTHNLGSPRSCSCPGFRYNRGKMCRHMAACEELLSQW